MDLQVVEGPPHGYHHLAAVAGSHTDVLALRLLPLADKGFGFLRDQPHGCGSDLGAEMQCLGAPAGAYAGGGGLTHALGEP